MRVLVTGGTGSIGKEIVNIFSDKGHTVYSPDRKELDLSKTPILEFSDFDIVINNAGINPLYSISEIDEDMVMHVNYTSPLKIIQQCLPYMVSKKYGRIVNIGSILSSFSKPKRTLYSASKAALDSLSRSITVEYAGNNILCNTVSPGYIETSLTHKNNTIQDIEQIVSKIPMGRLGSSLEVAKLVYFLTIENTYISGQNFIIDGGITCTM